MVRNCKRCDEVFIHNGADMCEKCQEEVFETILGYMKEHPNSSVLDIVRDTHVPSNIVLGLVQEGRLRYVNSSQLLVKSREP